MIDRALNYGRHHVEDFLCKTGSCNLIVDLGAGSGNDLRSARKIHPKARLVAVESWGPYQDLLRKEGFEVISLDLERHPLPFVDQSVDAIVVNQVLEHCKDIFWIFSEITRVLKVGGCVIVGVPNLAALHNRFLLAFGRQPTQIKSASAHVRGYTKGDILHFLESCFPAGYQLTAFGGGNFYPFPPVIAKPLARLFPTAAWGIFMMLRKSKAYSGEFLKFPVEQQLETNFWLGGDPAAAPAPGIRVTD
jgi:SAM-dependent methyltransferase